MNAIQLSVITFALAALTAFAGGVGDGTVRTQAAILPEPQKIAWGEGVFDAGTGKVSRATVTRFERDASVPKEGYRLTVTPQAVTVVSSDDAGAYYAVKTLGQLARRENGRTVVPAVAVTDAPAYPWRAMSLDVSRHFFGKETVKRLLDVMAEYKYNVFHWHLVDDQGWRLEIKRYPKLVEYGAVRPESPSRGNYLKPNGEKYGPFYYTQDDVREILAYAKERHITVMPEIELPGHSRAALAAYPELSCVGAALQPRTPWTVWGISEEVYCAGNDAAIKFLEDVLDEVCGLFDSPVVHIGGDECPRVRWQECPKCQARVKAEGLKDASGLQAWMTSHFTAFLAKRGRRTIGWDEILDGDIPTDAIVMSWNGAKGGIAAAKKGHDVVMTPLQSCYFIFNQGLEDDPVEYSRSWYFEPLPTSRVYAFDPVAGIPESARKHVLGAEGCLWSEYIWTDSELMWSAFPRALALSEVLWTGAKHRSWEEFSSVAEVHRRKLISRNINCAPLGRP